MSRKPADPAPPRGDDQHPVRIAKAIARAGLASRRDAEAWIAAGRVAVNGETIATPAVTVTARDRITVDGTPLPQHERTRLFLYYKPVGLVTTNADPQGRPNIFAALPKNLPRLVSVGRLDIATEGLLLLTNDGGLARVLELPATGWLRRYRVRAHGRVDAAALARLSEGITIDGVRYGPIEATLDRAQGANVWLTMAIREGKNREVRKVVDALGLQANRLIRVSFGPFQLSDMRDGEVIEVKTRVLRDQLGERIAAEAGCDFSAPIVSREIDGGTPPKAERLRDRRGERPAAREGGRPRREDRPTHRRDERDQRVRPMRRDRDEGAPPRNRQGERRPRRRQDEHDVADKPAGRPRRGHAWRSDDAPLGRHYRGAGSKARETSQEAGRPKRAGLIADRKGRRVLVERFGEKAAPSDTRADRNAAGHPLPSRERVASVAASDASRVRGRPESSSRAGSPPHPTPRKRSASPSPARGEGGKGRPAGEQRRSKQDRRRGKLHDGSTRPGPRDRPRGAGPRPSRPGPKKRR
ncbi:MAG: pseudouridine synthase [Xanthobacteraceae bacterium]